MQENQDAEQTLLLVHGRGTQPDAAALGEDWCASLAHGLQRDHNASLDGVNVELIYFGGHRVDFSS